MVDRLEAVIQRVQHAEVDRVLCHGDLIGDKVLIGEDGEVVAIVDWDGAELAPREHDLRIVTEGPRPDTFLDASGPVDLDPDHL
jgi:aminoglycoside phosphotransferase (APT) family kinase protein